MCAVCVSPALDGWPIFILCTAGVQRREGRLTEALRSRRLPFRVLETVRGASCRGWRAQLHRRAWQQLRDEDLPGAIIIEDGARLMPGFVEFLTAGGYLHADLTQFSYGKARVWLWGGCDASPNVALRPLAASTGLAPGYALSWRGASRLLDGVAAETAPHSADWPCDVARLGALVTRPMLVEPPEWLAESDTAPVPVAPPVVTANDLPDWRDLAAATVPASAAEHLRGLARRPFGGSLSPGL